MFKFLQSLQEAAAPKGPVALYLRQIKMYGEDDAAFAKKFKAGQLSKTEIEDMVGEISEDDPDSNIPDGFANTVYAAYKAKFGGQVNEGVEDMVAQYLKHIKTCCDSDEMEKLYKSGKLKQKDIKRIVGELLESNPKHKVPMDFADKVYAAYKAKFDTTVTEGLTKDEHYGPAVRRTGKHIEQTKGADAKEEFLTDVRLGLLVDKIGAVKTRDHIQKAYDEDRVSEKRARQLIAILNADHYQGRNKLVLESWDDEDDADVKVAMDEAKKRKVKLLSKDEEDKVSKKVDDADKKSEAKGVKKAAVEDEELSEMARGQVNGSGDPQQYTWAGWKAACKKKHADCEFRGDRDIGGAFVKVNGKGIDIGEWDGETGCVFKDSHEILQTYRDKPKKEDEELSESEVYSKAAKVGKSADIKKYIAGKYNVLNQSVGRWTIKEGDNSFRVDPAARPVEVWCEEASPALKKRARTIQDDINRKLASMGNISESACDDEDCDVKAAMDEVQKRKIKMLPKAVERALDKQVKQADDRSERSSLKKVRGTEDEEGSSGDPTNSLYIVDKMSKRSVLGPFNDQASANDALGKREDRNNLIVVPGNRVQK